MMKRANTKKKTQTTNSTWVEHLPPAPSFAYKTIKVIYISLFRALWRGNGGEETNILIFSLSKRLSRTYKKKTLQENILQYYTFQKRNKISDLNSLAPKMWRQIFSRSQLLQRSTHRMCLRD